MILQCRHETVTFRVAAAPGQSRELLRTGRQVVGLLFINNLDTVLGRAQEPVGCAQVVPLLAGDQALVAEELQRLERVAFAQARFFAGVDQLQGLDEEPTTIEEPLEPIIY